MLASMLVEVMVEVGVTVSGGNGCGFWLYAISQWDEVVVRKLWTIKMEIEAKKR